LKEADQVADGAMAVLGVAERELRVDVVAVAAAVARGGQVAGLLEVLDDLGAGSCWSWPCSSRLAIGGIASPTVRFGGC
jgi:hypothetical protein